MEITKERTSKPAVFEVEVSHEGEGGLQKCFIMCDKNPDHAGFIPIKDFTYKHLPSGYQHKVVEEVIKALADITVRVSVTQISKNRPSVFSVVGEPCQVNAVKERSPVLAAGTGRVFCVDKFTENSKENCPCDICKASANPRTQWGVIHVHTANHVVFDDTEAEHTTCHLFDDGLDDNSVIKLQGMKLARSSVVDDTCQMTHITHDMEVVNKLFDLVRKFLHAHCKAHSRYIDNWYCKPRQPQTHDTAIPRLSIMVSYCQGSTNQVLLESPDIEVFNQPELSYPEDTVSSFNGQKKLVVPLNKLNLEHLPRHFQDNDIVDLIHLLSDNTVRITVSYVSGNRPQVDPGNDQFRPSFDSNMNSEIKDAITGSGTVLRVARFTQDMDIRCECKDCELSSSPRKDWGFVLILTSRDTVYDSVEAAHATCSFSGDKIGSKSEHALSGVDIHTCSAHDETNSCILLYATHNIDVVDTFYAMRNDFFNLYKKIQNKFSDNRYAGLRVPGTRDLSQRLTVIVSHPHGLRKHVSAGVWILRKVMGSRNDTDITEYTYTAPTCRGSSGASIFTLGRLLYSSHHPHSRGQEGNINTSAAIGDV